MIDRRRLFATLGAAIVAAPLALLPGPTTAQASGLILGDNARIENVEIPQGYPVVIRGDNVVFQGNVINGGGLHASGNRLVIANCVIHGSDS